MRTRRQGSQQGAASCGTACCMTSSQWLTPSHRARRAHRPSALFVRPPLQVLRKLAQQRLAKRNPATASLDASYAALAEAWGTQSAPVSARTWRAIANIDLTFAPAVRFSGCRSNRRPRTGRLNSACRAIRVLSLSRSDASRAY
jgi:hypothetical protein